MLSEALKYFSAWVDQVHQNIAGGGGVADEENINEMLLSSSRRTVMDQTKTSVHPWSLWWRLSSLMVATHLATALERDPCLVRP